VVETAGLENRCARKGTVGSNPTLSVYGFRLESPVGRPFRLSALVSVALLLLPAREVAQSAAARLVAARAALRGAKLDSAELLLREALDSASGPTAGDRVETWLLIGVTRYYKGDDSGVVAAFRVALTLDPQLAAPQLALYDSSLVAVLATERRARSGAAVAVRVDTIAAPVCVPACPKGITAPRLRYIPPLDWSSDEYDQSIAPRDARLVVRFVVDTAGRVDSPSLHVQANNLPPGTVFEHLVRAYLAAVASALYDPARVGKRAVAVIMQSELRLEVARGVRIHGFPVGRHF
jgi:hypothetical protein